MTSIRSNAGIPGFSSERLGRCESLLLRSIEAGVFPGCAVSVSLHGKSVWRRGYGQTEPGGDNVTPDTMYDLASLTKPLACASSIMVLLERGEITLMDEIPRFFDAPAPHLKGITLRHLLTHTSGLPAWKKLYALPGPEPVIQAVLATEPGAPPGERYAYSDLGYILLGEIVRQVTGKRLDDFAREEVFRPLRIETLGYWSVEGNEKQFRGIKALSEKEVQGTAPTRCCPLREGQTLSGEVHDANCRAMNGVSGHAGLFGTIDDVKSYLVMLLRGGKTPDGKPFFSPSAVKRITVSQVDSGIGGHTLGWFAPPNGLHWSGDLWADRGFSHTGFTGTSAFADPETGISAVLLTNAVYFSTGEHIRLRRTFMNALAAAYTGFPEDRTR